MPTNPKLSAARELAATNTAHYPNESAEYRAARNALLAEEIEVRRHLERAAAQRRSRRTSISSPRTVRSVSPVCSATKTRCWFTA